MISFDELKLLLEVSIDQLRHDWVDSGKMNAELFDVACQCAGNQSAYATWLVKRLGELTNWKGAWEQTIASEHNRSLLIQNWNEWFDTFTKYKQYFDKKDINQYKSEADIIAWVDKCQKVKQEVEEKKRLKDIDRFKIGAVEIEKDGERKGYLVYKLPQGHEENRQIAIELGKTDHEVLGKKGWCTSSGATEKYWLSHINQEDLYIFINPRDRKFDKYQVQFGYSGDRPYWVGNDKGLSDAEVIPFIPFYDFLHEKENRPYPAFVPRVKELAAAVENPEDNHMDMFKIAEGIYELTEDNINYANVRSWVKPITVELLHLPESRMAESIEFRSFPGGRGRTFIIATSIGENGILENIKSVSITRRWIGRRYGSCNIIETYSPHLPSTFRPLIYPWEISYSDNNNTALYQKLKELQGLFTQQSNIPVEFSRELKQIFNEQIKADRVAERARATAERRAARQAEREAARQARANGQVPNNQTAETPEILDRFLVTTEGTATFYSVPANRIAEILRNLYGEGNSEEVENRVNGGTLGIVAQKGMYFFVPAMNFEFPAGSVPAWTRTDSAGRILTGNMNPDKIYEIYKKFKENDESIEYPEQIKKIADLREGRLDRFAIENIGQTSKLYMFSVEGAQRWIPYSLPSGWERGCRHVFLGYINKWQFVLTDTGKFMLTGRWGSGGTSSWIRSVPGLSQTLIDICNHYNISREGVLQSLQELCNRYVIEYPIILEEELRKNSMLLLEVSIDQLRQQWVETGKIDPEIFERICRAVNGNSNWATWLVKRVSQGYIEDEDIEQWTDYMNTFERYKVRFQTKDINTLKTPEQIANFAHECVMVQQAADERIANTGGEKMKGSKEERKREVDRFRLPDYKSLRGDVFEVFKLPKESGRENQKYAIELGTGTSWCTAARGERNLYRRYIPKGSLYIFINKTDPSEKYQIHLETDQFKNKLDREVDYDDPFYLDFFRYLQRVDKVTLCRKALVALERADEFEKFKRTHNMSELLQSKQVQGHISSGDRWYRFDPDNKEDRFIMYELGINSRYYENKYILEFNILYADVHSKSMFCVDRKNQYLQTYAEDYTTPLADGSDLPKRIKSKQDYDNLMKFLHVNNINFDNDSSIGQIIGNIAIKFDSDLLSAKDYSVGKIDNFEIYDFRLNPGRPNRRAMLELGLGSLIREIVVKGSEKIVNFDLTESRYFNEFIGIFSPSYSRNVILPGINDSFESAKSFLRNLRQLLPNDAANIDGQMQLIDRIVQSLSYFSDYVQNSQKVDIGKGKELLLEQIHIPDNFISFTISSHLSPVATMHATVVNEDIKEGDYVLRNTSKTFHPLQLYRGYQGIESTASVLKIRGIQNVSNMTAAGFTLKDIVNVAEKLDMQLPGFVQIALDKERKKKEGTVVPRPQELLRQKQADFTRQDISIVRPRFTNGIEGTWEEFGPSICRASDWGSNIQDDIRENGWTARVVLYWYGGRTDGHDWNMFCELKDQNGNRRKLWMREGSGQGVGWKTKTFDPVQNLQEVRQLVSQLLKSNGGKQILNEVSFKQYKAVVLFKFPKEDKEKKMGVEKLAEMIRALPGATRVSTIRLDRSKGICIMSVRLISQKPPKEAFISLKENALHRFKGSILDVKVQAHSIEVKSFIK